MSTCDQNIYADIGILNSNQINHKIQEKYFHLMAEYFQMMTKVPDTMVVFYDKFIQGMLIFVTTKNNFQIKHIEIPQIQIEK